MAWKKWVIFTLACAGIGCKPMDLLIDVDNFEKTSYQETYLGMLTVQKVVGDKVDEFADPIAVSMTGNGQKVEISGLTGIGSIRLSCGSYYQNDSASGKKLVAIGRVAGLAAEVLSETEMAVSDFLFRDEEAVEHEVTVTGQMVLKENKTVLETVAPDHISIRAEVENERGEPINWEVVRIRFAGELTTPI
jgi:hypothetical protein